MPRRKNTKPETIDEVIEEISTVGEEFKDMLSENEEKPDKVEPQTVTEDVSDTAENKRNVVLKLAEDGKVTKKRQVTRQSISYTQIMDAKECKKS